MSMNTNRIKAVDAVLGFASPRQRRAWERRKDVAVEIDDLQRKLHPLTQLVAAVAPPEASWKIISARIEDGARTATPLWRWFGIGAGLAAACLALLAVLLPAERPAYRADVHDAANSLVLVAEIDRHATITIHRKVTPGIAADKSLELWIIPQGKAPLPLGVIASGTKYKLPQGMAADGSTIAVSLEPLGGSPTGAPTGPVLATGAVSDKGL